MSHGRILVVDDDPQIRRVMRATLVSHGYEVLEARDGQAALDEIGREWAAWIHAGRCVRAPTFRSSF